MKMIMIDLSFICPFCGGIDFYLDFESDVICDSCGQIILFDYMRISPSYIDNYFIVESEVIFNENL